MILVIMATSKLFSQLLAFTGGATALTQLVTGLDLAPIKLQPPYSRTVINSLAIALLAALGVFGTGTGWPDFVVASLMAGLAIHGAVTILRDASREWREAGRVHGVHMLR